MSVAQHPNADSLSRPLAEFVERHDTLKLVLEWIADRFADSPEVDTSIAWEDGEEHDDDGPAAA
jgi:hypothetical protein